MRTIITNGKLILKDQLLEGYEIVLAEDKIDSICPVGQADRENAQICDAGGSYIMPGIIDIHSDMIESYIQPRSTAIMNFEMGLKEAEKVLAGCGITTMFHSISMYKEGAWDVKEIRQAPQVRKLAALVARYRHEECLIRHRYHLRYEIDNVSCYDDVLDMIKNGYVDLLSFMDHTPGQGQYKNLDIYRKHQKNGGKDMTEEEFQKLIQSEMEKEVITMGQLKVAAGLAKSMGISVASHDDDTIEKLELNEQLGVSISEFPITMEVAKAARQKGYRTVMGAPNILLGGSHSGNLSAMEAIRENAADILVSDYYPQALLQAVFHLFEKEGIPAWEAVRYVTLNPALATGLDETLGSLEEGKMADLLIVRSKDGHPILEKVFVAGECVLNCNYRKAD